MIAPIDFISRECKNRLHRDCYGKWQGLRLEVSCICACHDIQREEALESVPAPSISASNNDAAVLVTDDDRI